jgi:integrase
MNTTAKDQGWRVWKRGDGRLVITFRVDGGAWKDRRIPPGDVHTEPQAERWAAANVERLRAEARGEKAAKPAAPVVVRVADLEDAYLKVRRGLGLRPKTIEQDECAMRAHIVPRLGDVAVVDVDSAVLLDFVDRLKARGAGASVIRSTLSVLRQFLDVVKVRKLAPITSNPTRDPEFVRHARPRKTRSPKVQLTIETVEKVLTLPDKDLPEHWRLRVLIACTTGLRDGEVSGLTWDEIDLDAAVPVLHVRKARALVRDHDDKSDFDPTKTEGSVRDVPLHPETVKALKAWKARGFVEWCGRRAKTSDPVIPSEQGQAWRPSHSAESFRDFLVLAGCPTTVNGKPVTFHALRRSFVTWLARAGVERAVRKLLMGHDQHDDVTEEHYIERDLPMLYEAVCKIRLDLSERGQVIAMPVKRAAAK